MAKSFFAQQSVTYEERDVTTDEGYMQELKDLVGRFITPILWIDGETVIGFGMNLPRIRELLRQGDYLSKAKT